MARLIALTILAVSIPLSWPGVGAQRAAAQDRAPHTGASPYFPERFGWEYLRPEDLGMNPRSSSRRSARRRRGRSRATAISRSICRPRSDAASRSTPPSARRTARPGQRPHRHGGYVVAMGRAGARRHDVQRHQDVSDDGRRPRLAARAHPQRQRPRPRLHAAGRRPLRGARTTRRSPGTICCARRATGRARCGASPTGRIVRTARRRPIGPTARCASRAPTTSTTTCASTCSRSLRCTCWRRPLPRGAARGDHGADRRLDHVALARLRELLGRDRRRSSMQSV